MFNTFFCLLFLSFVIPTARNAKHSTKLIPISLSHLNPSISLIPSCNASHNSIRSKYSLIESSFPLHEGVPVRAGESITLFKTLPESLGSSAGESVPLLRGCRAAAGDSPPSPPGEGRGEVVCGSPSPSERGPGGVHPTITAIKTIPI